MGITVNKKNETITIAIRKMIENNNQKFLIQNKVCFSVVN